MKIIKKPNIINQKCSVCGTEVEITHKEIKKKVWKCPFCATKNKVVFKEVINTVEPKPNKKRKRLCYSPINNFIKANPSNIKIINFKSYKVTELTEEVVTKLFELIQNGFNTPSRLATVTGLSIASCSRYAAYLKKHKLISGTGGTAFYTLSHVRVERVKHWKPSL